MKNIVIIILGITAVVATYITASSSLRLKLEGLQGKTATIALGDLTIPINATGTIRPHRRVQIKSEASGEVIEIARYAGESVKTGELLIRLQPDEEKRAVKRASLEQDRAQASLDSSKVALQAAKTADLAAAAARVNQVKALLKLARYRADRARETPDLFHDEERLQRLSQYEDLQAQLDLANANYQKAEYAIPRAEQTVKQMEAAFEVSKQSVADTEKRLQKTDLVSPIDGIVANISTDIGEVIQGGKTTITGGTIVGVVLDMSRLILRAEVDEADIGRVLALAPPWAKPGHSSDVQMPNDLDEAAKLIDRLPEITVESFPDITFHGIILRIPPEPDSMSGVVSYNVEVVILDDTDGSLLPGMRADIRFTSEHVENVVLCPNEAIREGPSGKLGVYVPVAGADKDEHKLKFIPCKLGLDNGNYSEVREGLKEGMVVYTKLPAKTDRNK